MDNPPERYSLWISTGRFGGSAIHRNSPVDDVDIHCWIYYISMQEAIGGQETFQRLGHAHCNSKQYIV